jgi:ketopantoate reductase
MPRLLAVLLSLVAALGLTACGGDPTHEDVARDAIGTMNEFAGVLAKCTDKASAEKHKGELEAIATKMKEQKAKMEKMGAPSKEDEEAMKKKLDADMQAAMQKMMQEAMRISQNQEVMAVVGPVLEKMGQ